MARPTRVSPYLAELIARPHVSPAPPIGKTFRMASYNIHRWAGVRGGKQYEPERAIAVIDEIGADVLALQEVLRPSVGDDPLRALAEHLDEAMDILADVARNPAFRQDELDKMKRRELDRLEDACQLAAALGVAGVRVLHEGPLDTSKVLQRITSRSPGLDIQQLTPFCSLPRKTRDTGES